MTDSYEAYFYDGRTAQRRPAEVTLLEDALVIRFADRTELLWPLRQVEVAGAGEPLRLCHLGPEDDSTGPAEARLTIAGAGFRGKLLRRAPHLAGRERSRRRVLKPLLFSFVVLAVLATFFFWGLTPLIAALVPLIPQEVQRDLGRSVETQIFETWEFVFGEEVSYCRAPEGVAVLQGLVSRLGGDEAEERFQVEVIDIDMVNAVALPGGRILIFEGLLDFAEQPEEVAAVLAHEMGHELHRHGMQAMVRQVGLDVIFGYLLSGGLGDSLPLGTLLGLSYSRDAERQADREAIALLEGSGIRASGLAAFFQRLEGAGLPDELQLLSTHPPSQERIALSEAHDEGGPAMSAEEWRVLQGICSELRPREETAQ